MLLHRRRLLSLVAASTLPLASTQAKAAGLRFPHDHGAHPGLAVEWWYLTGLLGEEHGYQLTFFRVRGPSAMDSGRFSARQLLIGHLALSDLKQKHQRHDQRLARVGFQHVQAAEGDTALRIYDWQLQRKPDGSYLARAASATAGFALELELAPTQQLLLQGEQGLSRKGPTSYSHYYSQVQLQTRGRLQLEGRERVVQGRSWLDHEWTDQLLEPEAVGWDWLGINLLDGGALTAFRLRRADGSTLSTGGSWRKPDDTQRSFAEGELRFEAQRRWRSPSSKADYPVEWRLESPLGPLQLRALFEAQEIDARRSTGLVYWEGASELLDSQGRRIGLGYLEMTGYAARFSL
ncbi:lipocalin-like domain-containing protein [Pelomonas sp. SE-A7]|uniref:lipocalin-like domain-containing protein n=1 Tax=Pelomonas sp. SE-A7 TaxID=3054953 RepID=UPI00259C6CD4|nr:lipocalin-like domain-containing protein [Pelomonas sp. SE-A7]MDM4765137.1 lipocalin-like domain-containing protein [Pelomonas sp. SE-A7]